ncbi:uncharacterized protein LOC133543966 [Nerophis ophidion]|uniref:uncharacterized protein LOC133543966 n=1 Tax=Nerophis ophidion TaxID=159077 RepID=UPI002ADFBDEA|nr:uncharacterized protein LOC133543966 [Nerophis ophidion]
MPFFGSIGGITKEHQEMPGVNKFAEEILKGQQINIKTNPTAVNNMRLDIATVLLRETDDLSKFCHSCGMEESDDPNLIRCDICDRWFHHECVLRPDLDGDYLCPACVSGGCWSLSQLHSGGWRGTPWKS